MAWLVVLTIFSIALSLVLSLGTLRTLQTQTAPGQKTFLAGNVPSADGVYKGSVRNLKTNWVGKKFDFKKNSGINNFKENEKVVERYPFKTYIARGIQDGQKDVLKIDYNVEGNPFWLRMILDEVVETKPNILLGKLHVRILPGVAFTLGYFNLEK